MTAERQEISGADTAIAPCQSDPISTWLAHCRNADDASESTLRAYRKGMEAFGAWLQESGNPGVVTPAVVVQFKGYLQERYSPQTVNLRLSAVRSFYRWMVINEWLSVSPAEGVKGAKRPNSKRHKRDALSNLEVLAVLETCDEGLAGTRDRAILTLMAYCALRTIEVRRANIVNLRTKDDRLILEIQGKGHREADEIAVVPQGQEWAVRAWLAERVRIAPQKEGEALFVSLSNRSHGQRLTTRAIRAMIKDRYRQAGVAGSCKTSHSLRHSSITNAMTHGATPLQVKALARHGTFDTSLIYFHEEARTANPAEDLISYEEGRRALSTVRSDRYEPCQASANARGVKTKMAKTLSRLWTLDGIGSLVNREACGGARADNPCSPCRWSCAEGKTRQNLAD